MQKSILTQRLDKKGTKLTYCIGWKTTNYACLIADSAITGPAKPTHDFGTFGEAQQLFESGPSKGMYIEEKAVKIVHLSDKCAVGYAGYASTAKKIIKYLIDNDHLLEDIPNALKHVNMFLGPFTKNTSLIFAAHYDNEPVLLTWNTLTDHIQSDANFYEIGSLKSIEKTIAPDFLACLASNKVPEDECLEIVMSMVQSYGVHELLCQQNIGGAICGTKVSSESVLARMEMQWSDERKKALSDYIILNDDKCSVLEQVLKIHNELISNE